MRISATTLESFRLWRQPEQEWMSEEELRDSILGVWKPNPKVLLGLAFGKVLEDPDRHMVPGGFRSGDYGFDRDVIEPCLAVIDRRGVFEAKAVKAYGPHEVASKADHILGSRLSEFKTTLSAFDFEKYAASYQWRFMVHAFAPTVVTYHIFCLDQATNGVISLKDIHSFDLFPYAALHRDCATLVQEFAEYATVRGLAAHLQARQEAAA